MSANLEFKLGLFEYNYLMCLALANAAAPLTLTKTFAQLFLRAKELSAEPSFQQLKVQVPKPHTNKHSLFYHYKTMAKKIRSPFSTCHKHTRSRDAEKVKQMQKVQVTDILRNLRLRHHLIVVCKLQLLLDSYQAKMYYLLCKNVHSWTLLCHFWADLCVIQFLAQTGAEKYGGSCQCPANARHSSAVNGEMGSLSSQMQSSSSHRTQVLTQVMAISEQKPKKPAVRWLGQRERDGGERCCCWLTVNVNLK